MNTLQEIESNADTFVVELNSIVAMPELPGRGESITSTNYDDELRITK